MTTRRFSVRRDEAGRTVGDWLRTRLSLPAEVVRRLVRERRVQVGGALCLNPRQRLRPGQRVEVQIAPPHRKGKSKAPAPPGEGRPASGPAPVIVYQDEQVVVVDKPAGLTTMRHAEDVAEFGPRARRFLPLTLADLLPPLLNGGRVRAVHRLDKETSGLVVFARTPEAERHLGRHLRAHTAERVYQAVVRGRAREGRIESWLVRDRGDGRRGSAPRPGEGQRAVTHVRVLEELGGYTLVECRLETGRTHQVRIHLGEAGTPLCGERVYDRPVHGRPLPDGSGAPRVALHAAVLGFEHPTTGRRLRWASPLPADLARLVARLRRQARGTAGGRTADDQAGP
jgi:23S rRNA pseudouridine1911/1915/1917 synthase